ncbi:MAG: DUF4199 domain-containing protein [Bacteroidia bacterium]|nr:DUF4199 domain-containing protein [Bacteroidia bacterium]
MENSQISASSIGIRFGMIGALISIIFSVVVYLMSWQMQSWQQWLPYILLFIIVFLAVKSFRETKEENLISFGECFKVGMIVTGVMVLVSMIWVYVYMQFIDPELVEMIMEKQITQMEDRGMSDEQIEQALSMSENFMSPPMMAIFAGVAQGIAGAIISLIVAAFMQKK